MEKLHPTTEYNWFQWPEIVSKFPGIVITDNKSLDYALVTNKSVHLGCNDKRAALEVLASRQAAIQANTQVGWVHSQGNLADGLSKDVPTSR